MIENKTKDTSHITTLENVTGIFISKLDSIKYLRLIERQRIKNYFRKTKAWNIRNNRPFKDKICRKTN